MDRYNGIALIQLDIEMIRDDFELLLLIMVKNSLSRYERFRSFC